jgi:hypothetical protein
VDGRPVPVARQSAANLISLNRFDVWS